jgi:hypothetical protein
MYCLRPLGSWVRIPLEAWICVRVFLCWVILCEDRGLESGRSPVQGVLPTVQNRLINFRSLILNLNRQRWTSLKLMMMMMMMMNNECRGMWKQRFCPTVNCHTSSCHNVAQRQVGPLREMKLIYSGFLTQSRTKILVSMYWSLVPHTHKV